MTMGDAWPVPPIEGNLEKLQGSHSFSAIDAAVAYHTVPVGRKPCPYLTFLTPYGTYQFKKMSFGAKNESHHLSLHRWYNMRHSRTLWSSGGTSKSIQDASRSGDKIKTWENSIDIGRCWILRVCCVRRRRQNAGRICQENSWMASPIWIHIWGS